MYWADEGGFGVPPKIGKANMNGSSSIVLVKNGDVPQAITIDLYSKKIYYSTQYPSFVSTWLFLYFKKILNFSISDWES